MTLGEFILFIRVSIRISKKKPIFVSFKNTKPPVGALFYEIDEENKGEDGFLHITYSGEENVCGSNQEQEHGDEISIEKEAANNPHATPVGIPLKQNIYNSREICMQGGLTVFPTTIPLNLPWVPGYLQSMREIRISCISSHQSERRRMFVNHPRKTENALS
ncbi:hypothetical protein ACFX10_038179 [Malus domestica]|uniref:Autophagy-related protein n=1 Tax=Malus domestica TaxID=3750 RepID=A0A498JKY9_MALDO|nr:hypothetical protein DVH24_008205 [Malus domestica]